MSWFAEKFERFRQLPRRLMLTHVLSKVTFGIGFGALLAIYLPQLDWQLLGWILIAVSMIIAIPSLRIILSKK